MTTNLELEDIARRLGLANFQCVMKDELKRATKTMPVNTIVNLENSDRRGSHWCMLYADVERKIYYSSFGDPIPNEAKAFLSAVDSRPGGVQSPPILTSDIQLQDFSEDTCGLYCVLILYLLNEGL